MLIASLLALVTLFGAGQTPAPAAPPADYVVGPQDVLSIVVFGEADLTKTVSLDSDGTFDYPYIGRVKAGGLTARQVADEIARRLKATYYVNPQVGVEITKFRSQKVIVLGNVHAPGQYPLAGSMSVLEVLAAAGSPTPTAASHVIVSRPAGSMPRLPNDEPGGGSSLRLTMTQLQAGQAAAGFALRDNDTITVPKADTVWVTGHVRTTGAVVLEPGMTVMQVISAAGGPTEKGAVNRVRIHRQIDGHVREVKRVILSDHVQPGDVIDVPQRFF